MKIKEIKCEQFAGIKNIDVPFTDNLNIIYGKNESGKSTIIELIFNLLFQNAALDKRSDKDFIARNFTHTASGLDGDVIDGTIKIENGNDTYLLTKNWAQKGGTAKLKNPDGTSIVDENKINEILENILKYGEGVYNEIIFTSQKIPQNTLMSIFNECNKGYDVKEELHSILMQSVATLGGADIDAIENKIVQKLDDLGKHFDMKTMSPEGGLNKEWKKEKGKILVAYYQLKNLNEEKDEVFKLEEKIENVNKNKKELNEELTSVQDTINTISNIETTAEKRKSVETKYNNQKMLEVNGNKDLKNWEDYENSKKNLEANVPDKVSKEDVKTVKDANDEINRIESTLGALKLSAKIDNKSDKLLTVTSIDSGKEIVGNDGEYDINGCAEINLDGIINVKLYPKNVDVDVLKKELDENQSKVEGIFKKYQVENANELSEKLDKYNEYNSKKANLENNYNRYIKPLENDYKSLEELKKNIDDAKSEQEKLLKQLDEMEKIPEEFNGIDDFGEYKKEKLDRVKEINDEKEKLNDEMQEYSAQLGVRESDSLIEKINTVSVEYQNLVDEYKHYEHIYDVFKQLKQSINTNPMSAIDNSFEKNLATISNNDITTITNSNDVLIKSKDNKLTLNTLSEGTKETIGVAFKLAVIENLFPNGEGLAIFDDSFTDLDEDRRKEACALIESFAKKNQVIFVTCDNTYLPLFQNANVIKI